LQRGRRSDSIKEEQTNLTKARLTSKRGEEEKRREKERYEEKGNSGEQKRWLYIPFVFSSAR
jgi:hypothetical protein